MLIEKTRHWVTERLSPERGLSGRLPDRPALDVGPSNPQNNNGVVLIGLGVDQQFVHRPCPARLVLYFGEGQLRTWVVPERCPTRIPNPPTAAQSAWPAFNSSGQHIQVQEGTENLTGKNGIEWLAAPWPITWLLGRS